MNVALSHNPRRFRTCWAALLMLAALSSYGCSSSSEPEISSNETPDQVVIRFLTAVQKGDEAQVSKVLTNLARQKTTEANMEVKPPGSSSARFAVGETQMHGTKAHVASNWSDFDASGGTRTENITWILKKDAGGWRICGMAAKVFDDLAPIELDFEDPSDMIGKQTWAEQEIARRTQQQRNMLDDAAKEQQDNFFR